MINKKNIKIGMLFIFGILLISFVGAYSDSKVQFSSTTPDLGLSVQSSLEFDQSMCAKGQDFILQIAPFGCTPAVVRDDLLEEQNVPVYCQIAATKINPLIQVEAIESIGFEGDYPAEVAGVGFMPAKAALGVRPQTLESSFFQNIGYAVIVLKKQENSSKIPEKVTGTLKAEIKYDIKNAFGVGKASLLLPSLTDAAWDEKKTQYSFWNSKGYLRAEDVEGTSATISLYDDTREVSSVSLKVGETSDKIYLPGFECLSSLQLKLDSLDTAKTKVKLIVDNDYVDVKKGDSFLDDRCRVVSFSNTRLLQKAVIKCKEDNAKGIIGSSKSYELIISPKLKISYDGQEWNKSIGDKLYTYDNPKDNKKYNVYLAYAGTNGDSGRIEDLEIGLLSVPTINDKNGLRDAELTYVSNLAKSQGFESEDRTANLGTKALEYVTGVVSGLYSGIVQGNSLTFISYEGKSIVVGIGSTFVEGTTAYGKEVKILGFADPVDSLSDSEDPDSLQAEEYYNLANDNYNLIQKSFASEKDNTGKVLANGRTFGEESLYLQIELNKNHLKLKTAAELCKVFIEKYPKSQLINIIKDDCSNLKLSSSTKSNVLLLINGQTRRITLDSIYEPSLEDFSADLTIGGPNKVTDNTITLTRDVPYYLNKFRDDALTVTTSKTTYYFNYDSQNKVWQVKDDIKKDFSSVVIISELGDSKITELIDSLKTADKDIGKKLIWDADGKEIESITLKELTETSAKVKISLWTKDAQNKIRTTITNKEVELKLNEPQNLETDYYFALTEVHLKRDAKVSIIPGIDNAGSQTNFTFTVGIEKRAIQLSPGKTKDMISNLNKTIEDWKEKSDKLAKGVKVLKSACVVAGLGLTVKNFFANLGGKGIARQEVMKGNGGWNDKCANAVGKDLTVDDQTEHITSTDQCFGVFSDKIDADVENYAAGIEKYNSDIKDLQADSTTKNFLGSDVDTAKFKKEYLGNTSNYKAQLKKDLLDKYPEGKIPLAGGDSVNITEFVDNKLIPETTSLSDLSELKVNSQLSGGALDDISKNKLESTIGRINSIAIEPAQRNDFSSRSGFDATGVNLGETKELTKVGYTTDYTFGQIQGKATTPYSAASGTTLPANTANVQNFVDKATNKEYLLVLNAESVVTSTYQIGAGNVLTLQTNSDAEKTANPNPLNLDFKKYDAGSYDNKYNNPEVKYYETAPYAGMPAVVPINSHGWYATTKQTLSTLGGMTAYDKSGRVASFYLCNVGSNGIQEGTGTDECQMINLGTGQPYNQFKGLSLEESKKNINCGVQAIEQASKAYRPGLSGAIKISTSCGSIDAKVGSPAVDISEMQCTDVMSPNDCSLLYNVCDPVICPSSRCDFGGEYPVKDPIQTGIIGGLVLCLPNFGKPQDGGVIIPICLTGVQAGIDGLVSIFESRRNCLQESLSTGRTVGICDEINSIYMCEFMWRQLAPLAELALPKIIAAFTGKSNSRGGGEYLGVQQAWTNAQNSMTFFTQYYAENSFAAFKARSSEEVGTEVCKVFVSGVVPNVDFFDALTEPDSPPQFMGTLQEIPFSTTTNPPTSQYKVYYHIFAGKDSSATYKVYLKGNSGGSFYQDSSLSRLVDQNYITKGGTVDQTKDFTAPAGYTQLCINVNGQEECGFQTVSTSFAVNYVKEQYLKQQIGETAITSEATCISGSASAYSLLNLNVEEGVSDVINPSVYNYGITRICATSNPELGTDINANTNGSRWVDVGYCDNQNMRCWLDTSKIDDITMFQSTKGEVLQTVTEDTLTLVDEAGKSKYVTPEEFVAGVNGIKGERDLVKKLDKINAISERVFYNNQKATMNYLRANIYQEWGLDLIKKIEKRIAADNAAKTKAAEDAAAAAEGKALVEQTSTLANLAKAQADANLVSQFKLDAGELAVLGTVTNQDGCKLCGDGAFNFCGENECKALDLKVKSVTGDKYGCKFSLSFGDSCTSISLDFVQKYAVYKQTQDFGAGEVYTEYKIFLSDAVVSESEIGKFTLVGEFTEAEIKSNTDKEISALADRIPALKIDTGIGEVKQIFFAENIITPDLSFIQLPDMRPGTSGSGDYLLSYPAKPGVAYVVEVNGGREIVGLWNYDFNTKARGTRIILNSEESNTVISKDTKHFLLGYSEEEKVVLAAQAKEKELLDELTKMGITINYVEPDDCNKCKGIGCSKELCDKITELINRNSEFNYEIPKHICAFKVVSTTLNTCSDARGEITKTGVVVSDKADLQIFPFLGSELNWDNDLELDPRQINVIDFIGVVGETSDGYRFYHVMIPENPDNLILKTSGILRVYLKANSEFVAAAFLPEYLTTPSIRDNLDLILKDERLQYIEVDGVITSRITTGDDTLIGVDLDLFGELSDTGGVKLSLFDKIKQIEVDKIIPANLQKVGGIDKFITPWNSDVALDSGIFLMGYFNELVSEDFGKIKVERYIGEFKLSFGSPPSDSKFNPSEDNSLYRAYSVTLPTTPNSDAIILLPVMDVSSPIYIANQKLDRPLWQIYYGDNFKRLMIASSGFNPFLTPLNLTDFGSGKAGTGIAYLDNQVLRPGIVENTLLEQFRLAEKDKAPKNIPLLNSITINRDNSEKISILPWDSAFGKTAFNDLGISDIDLSQFEIKSFIAQTGGYNSKSGEFGYRFYHIYDPKGKRYAILRVNMYDVDADVGISTVGVDENGLVEGMDLIRIAKDLTGFRNIDNEGLGNLNGYELRRSNYFKNGLSLLQRIWLVEDGPFDYRASCTLFAGQVPSSGNKIGAGYLCIEG